MKNKLAEFQNKLSIRFKDELLLKQVFVHRSYLNEHKDFEVGHNERLEFLGDAVLELVVTEYLYSNYSEPEGVLTNWRSALVKGESLSELSKKIGIDDLLMLSFGESKNKGKGRNLILANALEALIGAIYLDQGYKSVSKFIQNNLIVNLKDIIEKELFIDNKSKLQELVQEKFSITPHYELLSEKGPDHDKIFVMEVKLGDHEIGQGSGNSKQRAEQMAAHDALDKFDDIKH